MKSRRDDLDCDRCGAMFPVTQLFITEGQVICLRCSSLTLPTEIDEFTNIGQYHSDLTKLEGVV